MNFANLSLQSRHDHTGETEWTEHVDMDLIALIDKKELLIDGRERDMGSRYHAQLEFVDWSSSIAEVGDFLEQHIENNSAIERRKVLSIDDGHFYMKHQGQEYEEDSPDEVIIQTTEDRISFLLFGGMGPYIPFYQEAVDGKHSDKDNVELLISYFDEISNSSSAQSTQQVTGLSGLHDDLEKVGVVDHMERGHYQSALNDAFKILEENVRQKAGYDAGVYGTDLMHQAFNPEDGPLAVGDTASEKEGFMKLYAGLMQAFRNPASHRPIELGLREAHDLISITNLLLNKLPDDAVTDMDDETA